MVWWLSQFPKFGAFEYVRYKPKMPTSSLVFTVGERSNRTLFVLTVVTVLALPFNVIGGLFGMNVGGIPFSENGLGFWIVVILVTIFTALVGLWAVGKRPQ